MQSNQVTELGNELYQALREQKPVSPLTERFPEITIEDAYHISLQMVQRRVEAGEKIIGKKIGVTSKPVQEMLGVHQPDFGFLTTKMHIPDGGEVPIARDLISPRAEAEIAFVLKDDLVGPRVKEEDVLAATEYVSACFEIVDSRIQDWKIKIQDTVADNASCGVFVIGAEQVDPRGLDLPTCGVVVEKNGELLSTGAGAAVQGDPLTAVAWLANTLGEFGVTLDAGDIVLSGSCVPLEPVVAGDEMKVRVGNIGAASVRFV